MREEFPKSGENALNPEVSVEAGTELPKKKVDSNVSWNTLEKRTYDPLRQFKSDLVQARPYKSMQLRNV
jgi:hypothetical protein